MNELQREYFAFINNMDVRLGAFVLADLPESYEQEDGTQAKFPKDFSPEALPFVEHFVLSRFATVDDVLDEENRRFVEGLIRYLGETYLRALGGAWDHDEATGNGMPFIRPDTEEGPVRGKPIPLVAIVLTAVDKRDSTIFTKVLETARKALGPDGQAQRVSTGLSIGMLTKENSTAEEVEFLSRFVGTVEPGIAAWTKEQAEPSSWSLDRESLERLGRQLSVRYDTREEMMAEDEVPFVAGAMRFIGETIRRLGFGQWRYGAELEADDPRSQQPYIRFVIGDRNLDIVPWRLTQTALEDSSSIAEALDTILEMRQQEAAQKAAAEAEAAASESAEAEAAAEASGSDEAPAEASDDDSAR